MPSLRGRKQHVRRSRSKRVSRPRDTARSHRRRRTLKGRSRKQLGGGHAIASGAYGCVFKPALRCRGEPSRPPAEARLVTKLGRASDMTTEFQLLQQVRGTLETIPNFRDYFVIDPVTACTPAPLEDDDLTDFNTTCHNFAHPPPSVPVLDAVSVNQNLESLTALTMPDGGQDLLEVLISGGPLSAVEFQGLNAKLIELLRDGIVPMNAAGLVHGDVKLENIVAEVRTGEDGTRVFGRVRLIDWGSSVPGVNEAPEALMGRPTKTGRFFTANLPAGSVFLHEDPRTLDAMLARASSNPTPRILAEYYYDGITETATTDPRRAQVETEKITALTDFIRAPPSVRKMMLPHVMTIIAQFYDRTEKHLDVERYARTVFVKNCDVWGLLSVYCSLLTGGGLGFDPPRAFTTRAEKILTTFMYDAGYAARPMNVGDLARYLATLSALVVDERDARPNLKRARDGDGGDAEGGEADASKHARGVDADA